MIKLYDKSYGKGHLITSVDELPDLSNVTNLYLDVETKRVFDDKNYGGLYPWKGDKVCGIAFTWDDNLDQFYVSVRATNPRYNLPLEAVMQWTERGLKSTKNWINHNVVFDAMMLKVGDGVDFSCRLVDTLTLSKVHDSDRLGHGLKTLSKDWLGFDTYAEEKIKGYLKSIGSKSYADIPTDMLATYACDDVAMNRMLYKFLLKERPDDLAGIWEKEIKLASVLFDMEYEGLRIDPTECKLESVKSIRSMINSASIITEATGIEFIDSNQCIHEILMDHFGIPVLATKMERKNGKMVDTGRPTFDKDALPLYSAHPIVKSDPEKMAVVKAILDYRTEQTYHGLFLEPFLRLHDEDNLIHPSYNAVVRTGRMSCSRPNSQQQNKRSKKLIKPRKGYGLMSCDYSQVEFRLIIHYIKDLAAIAAYNDDPNTDFHQWVADLIKITRSDGKTLNFGMAYGAGKGKVTSELASNPSIIDRIGEQVVEMVKNGEIKEEDQAEVFKAICMESASEMYQAYHERLPGIKATANKAAQVCKMRGYVFNAYGRRRHLAPNVAYKAFNSIIQGCAMDIMKECMINLSPRYNEQTRSMGIRIAANVHDDTITEVPADILFSTDTHEYVTGILQSPSIPLRVPITTGVGVSLNNWAEAAGDDTIRSEDGQIIGGKIK